MTRFCTNCGTPLALNSDRCPDCGTATVRRPFKNAEDEARRFYSTQTNPLPDLPDNTAVERYHRRQIQYSNCPYCGGSGGLTTRSTISTGGIVYMGIMLALTLFSVMIFFPCALVPLGLLFLGLLFKEKHFACVNCGHRMN